MNTSVRTCWSPSDTSEMRVQHDKLYGVITGDVIESSKLAPASRKRLHRAMTTMSRRLENAFEPDIFGPVEIFGGDSWQAVLDRPELVLRAALFYRAGVRAAMESRTPDLRIAMAVGRIDFIPGQRVSEGDGPAFRLSGRALDAIGRGSGMRFRFPDLPQERSLDTVVRLVDALASRWSDKQALAMTGALQGWQQDKIAKTCWPRPISQQAVQQHLERAAWHSIAGALDFVEHTLARATGSGPVEDPAQTVGPEPKARS